MELEADVQALGFPCEEHTDDGHELVLLVDNGQTEDLVVCARPRAVGKEAEEQKPLAGVSASEIDDVEHGIPRHPRCIEDGVVRRGPGETEERAHLGEVAAHLRGWQCGGSLVQPEGASHALTWVDHTRH